MTRHRNYNTRFLIILLFIGVGSLLFWNLQLHQEARQSEYYQLKSDTLETGYDSLLTVVERLRSASSVPGKSMLSKSEVKRLKGLGLKDPVQQIKMDLLQNSHLIPYEGTLGGEMHFFSKANITILNSRWVLGYFEDGHQAGEALLKFQVTEGIIEWELLAAFIK